MMGETGCGDSLFALITTAERLLTGDRWGLNFFVQEHSYLFTHLFTDLKNS